MHQQTHEKTMRENEKERFIYLCLMGVGSSISGGGQSHFNPYTLT